MPRRNTSTLCNITLSADKDLIQLARAKARAAKTTLNEEFRNWLRQFTNSRRDRKWFYSFMEQLGDIEAGRKFTREEFYEE